ncbi:sugar phosphate isomerase/epimerase family protein [Variovorax saccharolyticus]|uniref:sugar phosphate isomerase/epimerase family protein n=1 Tax=Variovorax saccharolyticus TaxID=3053516 RepID=UPI002577BBEB|nr:TIM barrel protein [Variovorax sp. J31P216]MDM0025221.1 TIM barrel protein [Variovorax sp. J31P216]
MVPACLSLAHLTVIDAHPLELVDAASAGGFNAIGLRIVPPAPTDALVPVVGDEPLIRELLARMEGLGISVLDVEAIWIGPDIDVDALLPAFAVAQRLGARNVLTMGNDPDESRFTSSFARLCEAAAGFGLRVGLEFAAYTHAPSIHAAHKVVKAASQPNGGVLIDALHMMRSGGTAGDIAMLDPTWLTYCQLADGRGPRPATTDAIRAEARGGRFYPGEGEFPLAAILDALPEGLPIGVETPCAQYRSLPVVERARLCGAAAHRFLDGYSRGAPMTAITNSGRS